ncbi:MAG: hypothetical protein ACR5K4_01385 [Sodalis sp. (in: enterobacteria)]
MVRSFYGNKISIYKFQNLLAALASGLRRTVEVEYLDFNTGSKIMLVMRLEVADP